MNYAILNPPFSQLTCQASAMVTKGAVGVAVKMTAVQRHAVIVNESIYGAFSGLLVGDLKLQQPQLVREGVQKYDNKQSGVRYEVLGCSGADDDVIFQGSDDWPNFCTLKHDLFS